MITFISPLMSLWFFVPFIVRRFLPVAKDMYGNALNVPFIKDLTNIEHDYEKTNSSFRATKYTEKNFWWLFALWSFLVLAAMRPVVVGTPERTSLQSRDILLVTDISTSMEEADFVFQGRRLSRLNAVKAVVSNFIANRKSDRIGLILFGTRAYLQAPLTYDRQSVYEILYSMDAGMAGDTTAIGDALGLALKTLKDSTEKDDSKVIILLTDGNNNDGSIGIAQAIDLAYKENVKIYTIGVGNNNSFIGGFLGMRQASFDEEFLQAIAEQTGGKYFSAGDLDKLNAVYREIDRLETSKQEDNFIYPQKELFYYPVLMALIIAVILTLRLKER